MDIVTQIIFGIVAGVLYVLAWITGFTYVEVNVIVYYMIIPMTWIIMLDAIFRFHYLKIVSFIGYVVGLFCINNFTDFCVWVFQKSVILLNYPHTVRVDNITATNIPSTIVGPSYITNSVIICVLVPFVIYVVLLGILIVKRVKRYKR